MSRHTIPLPAGYRHADAYMFHGRDANALAEVVDAQAGRIRKGVLLDGVPTLLDITLHADRAECSVDSDGTASEAAIQDALSELTRGRTVLVIAHRLATITGVDRIVVLDRGELVETGSHDELVAADGTYARMLAAHESDLASDKTPAATESVTTESATTENTAKPAQPGQEATR